MDPIISINQNKDFKRAYYQGKYQAHPILVTYLVRNQLGVCRVGIVTSKKIGKSYQRNRTKRIIQAAYRENQPLFEGWLPCVTEAAVRTRKARKPCGFDLVFMARPPILGKRSTELIPIMRGQVKSLAKKLLSSAPPKGARKPSQGGKPTRSSPPSGSKPVGSCP